MKYLGELCGKEEEGGDGRDKSWLRRRRRGGEREGEGEGGRGSGSDGEMERWRGVLGESSVV